MENRGYGPQFRGPGDARLLEHISNTTNDLSRLRDHCYRIRALLDEGTYKLDSILNVVSSLKSREQNVAAAGGDRAVIQQLTEEQVDSLLEMLKSPAFHNIMRQVLTKWVTPPSEKQ